MTRFTNRTTQESEMNEPQRKWNPFRSRCEWFLRLGERGFPSVSSSTWLRLLLQWRSRSVGEQSNQSWWFLATRWVLPFPWCKHQQTPCLLVALTLNDSLRTSTNLPSDFRLTSVEFEFYELSFIVSTKWEHHSSIEAIDVSLDLSEPL